MSFISAGNTTTTTLLINGDTTGNLVFNTGGANTTALTLTNTQGANFAGSVSALNTFGFKNRIINGDMRIDQRNAGASVTPTGTTYTLDRWYAQLSQSSKLSLQQNQGSITPPVGFANYLGMTSLSAYSVSAGDYFCISQRIEGNNVADLAWGTANAKTATLSFWVYSSKTGTFGGSFRNATSYNYSYPFTYSIPVANTWTQISITVAGPTSGTWGSGTASGIEINIDLGSGSTYTGTAGAWGAGNYLTATGATSIVATNGATFYLTGVQLEVGSQATSFDFRDYGRELMLCQRYYTQDTGTPDAKYTVFNSGNVRATPWYFPVTMRTAPTITFNDANGNTGKIIVANDGGSAQLNTSPPSSVAISQNNWRFEAGGMGGTTGNSGFIQLNYFATAEL